MNIRKTSLYKTWKCIKTRCYNKNSAHYNIYGGKGIVMCENWKNNFEDFYKWSYENGYCEEKLTSGRNKLTIDRIDNNKGYCPENCRWVNMSVQRRNEIRTKQFTFDGKTMCLMDWSNYLGISFWCLYKRYSRGWPIDKIFTTPVKQ